MKRKKTILSVVEDNLCTGCGTCIALCPSGSIKLVLNQIKGVYVPKLDLGRCSNCGMCLKVCPGHEVDFNGLNAEIFGKKLEMDNGSIGSYLNCYAGYATDHAIRYNSASGGLVTTLLIFALEKRLIDGALVTRMKKDKPFEPEPFIARTKEDIIEAFGSKYCPVPANIALQEIIKAGENERFAVVGLPCHMHGIRKAEKTNPRLRNKIVLHLGLQCGHNDNFMMTEFILGWFNIDVKNLQKISYRGHGWPGAMTIEFKNGHHKLIPFMDYTILHELDMFTPYCCLLCCDALNMLADITLGDFWSPNVHDDIGMSIAISRASRGDEFIRNIVSRGELKLTRMSNKEITQWRPSMFRERRAKVVMLLRTTFGKNIPIYNIKLPRSNLFSYITLVFYFFENFLGSKRSLWRITTWILPKERFIIRKMKNIVALRKGNVKTN